MKSSSVARPVGAFAQRQVERKSDRTAEVIIGDDRLGPVRAIAGRAPVGEHCHLAHLFGRPDEAGRIRGDAGHEAAHLLDERVEVQESRARHRERPVVLREAFRQPQLARHVRPLEIEGFERARPDAFDVPAVEELVGDAWQQPLPVRPQRGGRRQHRAVAMLHPVVGGVRQVIGEKGVVSRFVPRELAEDVALLADDPFDVAHEAVDLVERTAVVDRDADRLAIDGELAHHDGSEFHGRVHQVLEVGRRELERRRPGMQLGGDAPVFVSRRRLEPQRGRPVVEPPGPHHRRRHVDVGMCRIDRQVGAIQRVAEHLVSNRRGAVMAGHHPAMRIRPCDRQRAAIAGARLDVVDVLREVVQRIAARRRAAHSELEGCVREAGVVDLDLHPPVLRLRKREPVADAGLRPRRVDGHDRRAAGRRRPAKREHQHEL